MEELAGTDPARLCRKAFGRTVEASHSGPVDFTSIVMETLAEGTRASPAALVENALGETVAAEEALATARKSAQDRRTRC